MTGGRISSVGYEGLAADELIERLRTAGVSTLVDVRLTPISRKPGLSKRALAAALAEVGIEYVHEPTLGNPKDNRASFQRCDGAEGRARMRQIVETTGAEALQRLVDRANEEHVAVLCFEQDHHRCHRSVITAMASELDDRIAVDRAT